MDCYIVDNNGYIVLSLKDSSNDTGKFFGDVEDDVLISMIEENIFEEVILYDLQALCTDEEGEGSSATRLMTVCVVSFNIIVLCNFSISAIGFHPGGTERVCGQTICLLEDV